MKETWGSTFIMYKSVVILISVGIGISILGFMWVEWADRTGMSGWKWDNGIVAVERFENCTSYQVLVNKEDYGLEHIYKYNDASVAYANYIHYALNDLRDSCESQRTQIFHTHFDLPNMYIGSTHMSLEKLIKIRMALQSFFVAHHPSPTRLILWTNNITLLSHEHITDVLEFVDVRFWDPVIESKGTPLEGRMREENLRKNDARNYFGGDLLRFIVLYKYGGLYWDTDVAFLKSTIPLMGTEFFYQWSCYKDPNTAVISLKKGSPLATHLLERIIGRQANNFGWGKDMLSGITRPDFHVLPCPWFDPLWLPEDSCDMGANMLGGGNFDWALQAQANEGIAEDLIRNWGFTYHWHNRWDVPAPPSSPFSHLITYFESRWATLLPLLSPLPTSPPSSPSSSSPTYDYSATSASSDLDPPTTVFGLLVNSKALLHGGQPLQRIDEAPPKPRTVEQHTK